MNAFKSALRDKWFRAQMVALLMSFIFVGAIFFALKSFAAVQYGQIREATMLQASQVESSLESYLKSQLDPKDGFEITFQRLSQIPFTDLPSGELKWSWTGPVLLQNGPRSVYQLSLSHANGWSFVLPVNVAVRIRTEVFFSNTVIQPRSLIKPESFDVKSVEMVPSTLHTVIARKMPSNKRSRGLIPRGAMLSHTHVEEVPAVQTGKIIDMIYQDGGLSVRLPVRAKQEGHIGQRIHVQEDKNQRIFQAEVIDSNTVRIVSQ